MSNTGLERLSGDKFPPEPVTVILIGMDVADYLREINMDRQLPDIPSANVRPRDWMDMD